MDPVRILLTRRRKARHSVADSAPAPTSEYGDAVSSNEGLLSGIKVVDFGRYVAGPWCAQLLLGMGADVLRVERPGGGEDRFLFPLADNMGAYLLHCNRGKRCMTLNPTKPAGREIVTKLVQGADVIVANMPDDALASMGLDWDTVHATHPRAILATASTFGSTGPYAGRVGFDGIGQVMSGSAYLSGHPGDPMKSFTPWVDYSTASNLAMGVAAALVKRSVTGLGVRIDASLLGTALTAMGHVICEEAATGIGRVASGNRHPAAGPSDIVPTFDGRIIVQVVGNPIFARFVKAIGRPDLIDDPRFATDELRGENGKDISAIATEWCSTRTTAQALEELAAHSVPAGPVLSPRQALDDEHVKTQLMEVATVEGVPGGVPVVAFPLRFSDGSGQFGLATAAIGEHTNDVLRSLGYSDDAIAELRTERII